MRKAAVLVFSMLLFAAAGCDPNQSGHLEAGRTGDLSNPPAPRGAPDAALVAACGDGEPTPAGAESLERLPYLQRVGEREAMVLWTSTSEAAAKVVVTRPDGTRVAEANAAVDRAARPAGARQLQATLTGLEPQTTYCYAIEAGGAALTSRTGFRTAPAAGAGARVRFVAFGDSGSGGSDQMALLEQLAEVPFDLMIHTGDIAYDDGTRAEFERTFFDVYAQLLRSFPMFPSSGNHEYHTDDAAPFREVFALPENGGARGRERWYSFDWGDVHFVALDTEKMGPEQAAWLEADLARNQRRWTIVYGHRPPFSSGHHGSSGAFRRTFVPILERHGVDLVLSGHDHHYERIKPQNGVQYVVTGGGGRGTYGVGISSFTGFSEEVIHFVLVQVEGDTLSLHAIDGTGQEFDSLVLTKKR